jgi:hypothetical protein
MLFESTVMSEAQIKLFGYFNHEYLLHHCIEMVHFFDHHERELTNTIIAVNNAVSTAIIPVLFFFRVQKYPLVNRKEVTFAPK